MPITAVQVASYMKQKTGGRLSECARNTAISLTRTRRSAAEVESAPVPSAAVYTRYPCVSSSPTSCVLSPASGGGRSARDPPEHAPGVPLASSFQKLASPRRAAPVVARAFEGRGSSSSSPKRDQALLPPLFEPSPAGRATFGARASAASSCSSSSESSESASAHETAHSSNVGYATSSSVKGTRATAPSLAPARASVRPHAACVSATRPLSSFSRSFFSSCLPPAPPFPTIAPPPARGRGCTQSTDACTFASSAAGALSEGSACQSTHPTTSRPRTPPSISFAASARARTRAASASSSSLASPPSEGSEDVRTPASTTIVASSASASAASALPSGALSSPPAIAVRSSTMAA
mmetsp:Transcript_10560/g.26592  ORF Transcript_10560/g.26592 Transcript_10560/m.26592 type:complete len:353 (-) Transcript_10560:451-1509(-)